MDTIQNMYKSSILIEQCQLIEVVNKGSNAIFSNLNGKKVQAFDKF
jgi:hypothetical protein